MHYRSYEHAPDKVGRRIRKLTVSIMKRYRAHINIQIRSSTPCRKDIFLSILSTSCTTCTVDFWHSWCNTEAVCCQNLKLPRRCTSVTNFLRYRSCESIIEKFPNEESCNKTHFCGNGARHLIFVDLKELQGCHIANFSGNSPDEIVAVEIQLDKIGEIVY